MKAEELRIGNLVLYQGEPKIIVGITEDHPYIDYITFDYLDWDEIEPIKLTEEWLVRFGFTFNSKFHLYEINKDFKLNWEFVLMDIDIYVRPNFVHELQNLYFALTGEELVIKDGI